MSKSLEKILDQLELTNDIGLYYDCIKSVKCPSRIKMALKYVDYDAIYTIENVPVIIFKEFNSQEQFEKEIDSLHKSVWNLGEVPILFTILPHEIRIYNGLDFDKKGNKALNIYDKKNKKELEDFTPLNLTSEKFWKKYGKSFQNNKRVQDTLLTNLRNAEKKLSRKTKLHSKLPPSIIHNLMGRLIFSRYLIDRNALSKKFFIDNYDLEFVDLIEDKEQLYEFFEFLKNTFNGDMFPVDPMEKKLVEDGHLDILSKLFRGYDVKTGQTTLFDIYDFKIIPIELISHIYETFLYKNKSKGVYYTPLFLVDYILNETLDKKLENNETCKILDPSCGSGIFLVEALRRLIEKKLETTDKLTEDDLKKILTENIFGVDKDPDAINISIFSIYLTLLDYQEPKNIENFTFPKLFDTNFFRSDFFDMDNEKLKTKIDLVIGNPPWAEFKGSHVDYCERNEIPIYRNQIAQAFLIKPVEFIDESSEIALIVTSKILYNTHPKAKKYRKYLLENFEITSVLESAPVRKKVFKKAIGPGAVLFYRLKKDGNKYIKHISIKPSRLFNLLNAVVIQKFDVKHVPQNYFIKYDWLWKVMVYGSTLDLHFIRRIKENPSIQDLIDENNLLKGVGIQDNESEDPQNMHAHLLNKTYLDAKKDMLQRYYIDLTNQSKWTQKKVHRRRKAELFEPPYILMKKGLDNRNFSSVAAFSDKQMVFKDDITAIKGQKSDEKLLKNILGLLNSKLFTYYIFLTGSSTGIEREQGVNPDKFIFPVIIDEGLTEKVDYIIQFINKTKKYDSEQVNALQNDLDKYIFSLYELNNIERDLVNYALDISIPLYINQDIVFEPPSEEDLNNYADIFIKHFDLTFNGPNEFFFVEIHRTSSFIAMIFKIVGNKPTHKKEFIDNSNIKNVINNLGKLSIEKRKALYMQRDIKGFNEDSFYVIKPNELKNWHKAVGRLDLIEFMQDLSKESK